MVKQFLTATFLKENQQIVNTAGRNSGRIIFHFIRQPGHGIA
tara:strand:+ start:268 stop:393 length:126 start_codon:yes stop_codon:yes gene_type:complete